MEPTDAILLMSPDSSSLRGLSRALATSGFAVDAVASWMDVESRLGHLQVPLLVADLDEFNSEDLDRVRRLRTEFPRVEIIALVSLSTPAVRAAERQGVVRAVLEKPIALARLEGTVRSALARTVSP
jgi:DNA-binding response OmpR family regulator